VYLHELDNTVPPVAPIVYRGATSPTPTSTERALDRTQQLEQLKRSGRHHEIALPTHNTNFSADLGGKTIVTFPPRLEPFFSSSLLSSSSLLKTICNEHWSRSPPSPRRHPHPYNPANVCPTKGWRTPTPRNEPIDRHGHISEAAARLPGQRGICSSHTIHEHPPCRLEE